MSEARITFVLQGDGATEAGHEFERLIATFDKGMEVQVVPFEEASDELRRALDPISLLTLILAIPSAALAVLDIADRIEKRRRATRLIEAGRRLCEGKKVQAFVLMPDGSPKRLQDLTPDQLLDLVAEVRTGSKFG
jgi:hypothetical protein